MKPIRLFKPVMMIMLCMLFFMAPILAQSVIENPDLKSWFENFDPVFMALTILGGYITSVIPGVKLVPGVYRVLTWAVLAGGAFIVFGFNKDVIQLVISYAFSTSLYEVFLKPLNKKTTK
jgi:hypothetical protein